MLETSSQRRLLSVQALRGLAAILVLMLHCVAVQNAGLMPDNTRELSYLSGFWNQGYAGVDLFFVISGFIMVYVTHDRERTPRSVGKFLYSRASRIYPLWWVYAGVMATYFWMTYGQPAAPDVVVRLEDVAPYTVKSFLLLPQTYHPVLGVGWTLIHEMYFYLVFAGLLFLPRQYMPVYLSIWAGVILIAMVVFVTPHHATYIGTLIRSPLTLEFIAGAFMGWLIVRQQIFKPKLWLGIGVFSTLAMLIIGLDAMPGQFVFNRALFYTLPFAALIYGLSALEHQDKLKVPNWCIRLGDWSYSLYLSHMLVLLTLRRIFMKADGVLPEILQYQADGYVDNIFFAVVAFVLAIVFSGVSYHLIETPLLKLFRRALRRKALAPS